VASLIQDATDRSPTFKRVVEAVQASDGIVYVVRGRCGRLVRSCLPYDMTLSGPNRILRVIVDDGKAGIDAAGAIAHELQHACEVLDDPSVTTGAGMHGLFERIGRRRDYGFETRAAIEIGDAVRAELRSGARRRRCC
jgi:hypothetical protein